MAHVPEEILERIISLSLPSTSILLVSKSWLRIATPLLYHTLHLRYTHSATLLAHTLSNNPALATAVRALVLSGVFPEFAPVIRACPSTELLDITLDDPLSNEEDAIAQTAAVSQALAALPAVKNLTVRKANVYLSQPKPRQIIVGLAHAIHQWKHLSTAHIAFRLAYDATGTAALLAQSLSQAPALCTLLTLLPTVWNPALLQISANPRLERIVLNPDDSGRRADSDDSDDDENENETTTVFNDNSIHSDSDSDHHSTSRSLVAPPKRITRTPAEQRYLDETMASIRLFTRHTDPYEEWERRTRSAAFSTAKKVQRTLQLQFYHKREQAHARDAQRRSAWHAHQVAEVQEQLAALDLRQKEEETKMRDAWKERVKVLWERIDAVIKLEEERVEAERKAKEEEERKKREEEERKRKEEEERKRKEEEERTKKEEEERRKKAEEEEAKRRQEEEERIKKERIQAEEQARQLLGFMTGEEDWKHARGILLQLKAGPMKTVKSQKELKSIWSALRRQITPKIGQLTNDREAIIRISHQIHNILIPPHTAPHPPHIYHALLSSLSKSILLQAETEVTAEKRSAGPLGQVAANLLGSLPMFADVFFAKLVQRAGGWPVPVGVPATDVDGLPWKDGEARAKVEGYRKWSGEGEGEEGEEGGMESAGEYMSRMTGMMRVYFSILKADVDRPLHRMFQTPRYWIWFARMLSDRELLETAAGAQIMYAALDVFGIEATSLWGQQWMKLLASLYEALTNGLGGGAVIGGQTPEGKASRTRVQLQVERIMNFVIQYT